jgi:FxsC-like protein
MPYLYFFSYARENRNDDLDRFVKNLHDTIRLKKYFPHEEVEFFDGDAIEIGAPWKDTLSTGLRTSRVFLALCSPDYINREYCGKEFTVFLERYRAYVKSASAKDSPMLILPILWGAPGASLRDVISEFQYTDDDFPPVYAKEGLRYMMQLKEHEDDYTKFVNRLAQKIVEASAAHPLPDLANLRPLDQVASAFHDAAVQPQAEEGDRAWFVFVAGKPAELKPPRELVDRYQKAGGRDWRPFHPTAKESVGLLAQRAAAQYDRYFTELPVQADLIARVDVAEAAREPVLVLVDPWTLKLPAYRDEIKKLDKYIASNCAFIVSWNCPDPETTAAREPLKTVLSQTFVTRAKHGKALHYWGEVESGAELTARLLEMLAYYTNRTFETTDAAEGKTIPEHEVVTPGSTPDVPLNRPPVVDNTPANNG